MTIATTKADRPLVMTAAGRAISMTCAEISRKLPPSHDPPACRFVRLPRQYLPFAACRRRGSRRLRTRRHRRDARFGGNRRLARRPPAAARPAPWSRRRKRRRRLPVPAGRAGRANGGAGGGRRSGETWCAWCQVRPRAATNSEKPKHSIEMASVVWRWVGAA